MHIKVASQVGAAIKDANKRRQQVLPAAEMQLRLAFVQKRLDSC